MTPQVLHDGLDSGQATESRVVGGIETRRVLAGASEDVVAGLRHDVDVRGADTDVDRGPVAPTERLHVPAECAQHIGLLGTRRVGDDDGLATAERQSGQGALVGHPFREPQHVGQGLVDAGVRHHPAAARGGAEGGAVDGDDGPQTHALVVTEDHVLVAVEVLVVEDAHPTLS